jgi:hypothetical protein
MRTFIFNVLNTYPCKLFHADLFPYKHSNIIDIGNCESILYHIAYGYALDNRKETVFVYDVSSFSLEQSLNLLRDAKPVENFKILMGGSGFVYYKTSHHHYCLNDISLVKAVNGLVFCPISKQELFSLLFQPKKNWISIRLLPDNFEPPVFSNKKIVNETPFYAYGWLYLFLHRHFTNVKRIVSISCDTFIYDGIVFEDHIYHGLCPIDKWVGVKSIYEEYSMLTFCEYVFEKGKELCKK